MVDKSPVCCMTIPSDELFMKVVWATFINYVEGHYEEVEKILRSNSLGISLKKLLESDISIS